MSLANEKSKMTEYNEEELIERARKIYFKSGALDQPSAGGEVQMHQGETYVLLRNSNKTLAVYWNHNGKLELADNYPASFE